MKKRRSRVLHIGADRRRHLWFVTWTKSANLPYRPGKNDIGHIKDFYFDDLTWTVLYLIVDTPPAIRRGSFFSPEAIEVN